jgi:hypothetical protein
MNTTASLKVSKAITHWPDSQPRYVKVSITSGTTTYDADRLKSEVDLILFIQQNINPKLSQENVNKLGDLIDAFAHDKYINGCQDENID